MFKIIVQSWNFETLILHPFCHFILFTATLNIDVFKLLHTLQSARL